MAQFREPIVNGHPDVHLVDLAFKCARHHPLATLLMQSSVGMGLICPIVGICRVTTCVLTLRTEVQREEIVFKKMRRMSVNEAASTSLQGGVKLEHICLRREAASQISAVG